MNVQRSSGLLRRLLTVLTAAFLFTTAYGSGPAIPLAAAEHRFRSRASHGSLFDPDRLSVHRSAFDQDGFVIIDDDGFRHGRRFRPRSFDSFRLFDHGFAPFTLVPDGFADAFFGEVGFPRSVVDFDSFRHRRFLRSRLHDIDDGLFHRSLFTDREFAVFDLGTDGFVVLDRDIFRPAVRRRDGVRFRRFYDGRFRRSRFFD